MSCPGCDRDILSIRKRVRVCSSHPPVQNNTQRQPLGLSVQRRNRVVNAMPCRSGAAHSTTYLPTYLPTLLQGDQSSATWSICEGRGMGRWDPSERGRILDPDVVVIDALTCSSIPRIELITNPRFGHTYIHTYMHACIPTSLHGGGSDARIFSSISHTLSARCGKHRPREKLTADLRLIRNATGKKKKQK
ncbi:hypothetical protein LX32DRAFT_281129 [Colletotrichum zoysiae]|uniref:Uncharacterized protein n=1 Tax=Colletotrichum zoysiae TaxID=1216348 RepID=A0AAD9LTV2_9PEZI|nr:hypothetical protein LX32DRAFT_281129 [Colletotrichum zoysiae]